MAGFAFVCAIPFQEIIAREFLMLTIILSLLFAFYFRMVIFFRQIFYLKFLAVQVLLFFSNPLLFVKTLSKMQEMFALFDSHDLLHFIVPGFQASTYQMNDAYHFFKKEFVLFSVGLLILIVFTELRIVLAFVERIKKIE